MRIIGSWRDGFAVETKAQTVISLGWTVFGWDSATRGYFIVHPFALRIFKGKPL